MLTGDDPRHVTAQFAAVYINWVTQGAHTTSEVRIRQWAARGHILKVGADSRGRILYDLNSVIAYTRSRGITVPDDTPSGRQQT